MTNMKPIKITGTMDGQQIWREETAEETLLNALKSDPNISSDFKKALNLPCEFCTHDTACRMHYNEQLELNVGSVEFNKEVKGNF